MLGLHALHTVGAAGRFRPEVTGISPFHHAQSLPRPPPPVSPKVSRPICQGSRRDHPISSSKGGVDRLPKISSNFDRPTAAASKLPVSTVGPCSSADWRPSSSTVCSNLVSSLSFSIDELRMFGLEIPADLIAKKSHGAAKDIIEDTTDVILDAVSKEKVPSYADITKNTDAQTEDPRPSRIPDLPEVALELNEDQRIGTKEGYPAVFFSVNEYAKAAASLDFAVIMRFFNQRPTLDRVREIVYDQWGLKEKPAIGILSPRQFLIRSHSMDDLMIIWSKANNKIDNLSFRLTRWQPNFRVRKDSPIVGTWVRLPGYLVPFCTKNCLEVCCKSFGKFISVDRGTLNTTHPSQARICVEVDASRPLPDKFWVGVGVEGYWQRILYEAKPKFCSHCSLLGHTLDVCRRAARSFRAPVIDELENGLLREGDREAAVSGSIPTAEDLRHEMTMVDEVQRLEEVNSGEDILAKDKFEQVIKQRETVSFEGVIESVSQTEGRTAMPQLAKRQDKGFRISQQGLKELALSGSVFLESTQSVETAVPACSVDKDSSVAENSGDNRQEGVSENLQTAGSIQRFERWYQEVEASQQAEAARATQQDNLVPLQGKHQLSSETNTIDSASGKFQECNMLQSAVQVQEAVHKMLTEVSPISSATGPAETGLYNIVIPPQTAKRIHAFVPDTSPTKVTQDFLAASPTKDSCVIYRVNSDPSSLDKESKLIQFDPGPHLRKIKMEKEVTQASKAKGEATTIRKRGRPAGSKNKGTQAASEP